MELNDKFENVMGSLKAMGQLSQISSMLAGQAGSPHSGQPSNAQPACSDASGSNGGGRQLASALQQFLAQQSGTTGEGQSSSPQKTDQKDTRLVETIERLGQLCNANGKTSTTSIAEDEDFQRLQREVRTLQSTVGTHSNELSSIKNTVAQTSNDVTAVRQLLEGTLGGNGAGLRAPPHNPVGGGGGGGEGLPDAPHAPDRVGEGLGAVDPLFTEVQVTAATHDRTHPVLGISLVRVDTASLRTELPLEYGVWWTRVARCKTDDQWKAKFKHLGSTDAAIDPLSRAELERYLFTHLSSGWALQTEEVQPYPA